MASVAALRTVKVSYVSEGADKFRADAEAAASSQANLAQQSERAALVSEQSARRQLSAATSLDRLRSSVDETFRAQQRLERGTAVLDRAFAQGVVDAAGYERTLGQLQARYGGVASAAERAVTAQRSLGGMWKDLSSQGAAATRQIEAARARVDASVEAARRLGSMGSTGPRAANENAGRRLRQDEANNLMYQGGDILAQLGSGSPLSMIAMQQGPQIAQVFAGPGGASVKAAFAQAGEAVGGFLTKIGPVGIGLGGVTLAAGVGAAALLSYRSAQAELERSIGGVGRASGVTIDSINRMADAQARAAGMSRSTARETAAIYAGAGRVGPELLGSAVNATPDIAKFLGVDQAEGATVLAGALGDVSRGATDLSERYGLLNDATAESIRQMDAQGDRLGAQKRLLDAVRASTQGLAEQTTGWGRVTQGVSDIWGEVGRVVDRAVTGGDLDTRLKTARDALAEARRDAEGSTGIYRQVFTDPRIATFEADVRRLEKLAETRDGLLGRLQSAQRSVEIGNLVRVLQPELTELQTAQSRVELLRKAISDPIKFGLDRNQIADATTAFERLSRLTKEMADDIERFGSASVAALNRTADFNLRTATMSPADRSRAEIENQFETNARSKQLDPNGRTSAQVSADYELRLGITSDLFERNRLAQERDRQLQSARELEGLRRARDVELQGLNARTEQSAIRSSSIPDNFLQAVFGAESGGRGTARNPLSTATGYGQFIEKTWMRMFREEFPERAAGMSSGDILSRRTDRADSERLTLAYARENARALERAQIPVNNASLYAAHHFGAEGAVSLYRANPNTPAREILGAEAARVNPRTIGNLTAGQSINAVTNLIARNDPSVRAVRSQTEQLRAEVGSIDTSVAARARLERVQELLNQEQAKGSEIGRAFANAQDLIRGSSEKLTPEAEAQRRAILEVTSAYGQATAAVNEYRGRQTLMFERDQLGRSSLEGSVYARTRSMYGETSSREAQAFMGQARENAEMYETKAMLTDGVTSFVSDLRRGGDAATALSNAFGNAADQLIAKVMDSAISSAFGAIGGSSGGGIGGFFSGLLGGGNATGATLYSTPAGPGFSAGGYTGFGGRLEPAGIVHRGEVVWSQSDVARVGGVAVAEAMRRGLPGYATGGPVGAPAWMPPASAGAAGASGGEAPIIINTTGQPAQTQRVQGPRGPRDAIVIGKAIAGAITSDPDVRDALAKAWGLKRVGR